MWSVAIVEIRITRESGLDRDTRPQKPFTNATWNTMALKVTITSTKGGVGKTTLTANLGGLLADMVLAPT